MSDEADSEPSPSNRRGAERIEVTWSVDCEADETFLYASITNISALGIFVSTREPLEVGSQLVLRFQPPGSSAAFVMRGVVQWVNPLRALSSNPNPGMGIQFVDLAADQRELLVQTIRTIAYVRESAN